MNGTLMHGTTKVMFMKYDFRVVSNGVSVACKINVRWLRDTDGMIIS